MNVCLIVYDNASYISWFPQGLAYLASVLEKNNHQVTVYNQDIHHYSEEHLTQFLNTHNFDIVATSFIGGYYQYAKCKKIASAINNASCRSKFKFIIGGHLVAPDPNYFLRLLKCDAVFIGEGEQTILKYIENPVGSVIIGRDIEDIDNIPMPAYHLFPVEHYRLLRMAHIEPHEFCMPILSGRGCHFECNFCYRMVKGLRAHSPEYITREMVYLHDTYGINYFTFTDELLMSGIKRTTELCNAFLKLPFKFKWDCNGRLNWATPELLELMKRSGCVFINYGIEAMDDTVLKNMNKVLTVKQIHTGIRNTLAAKISPGFNIIWGNIGDNLDTLQAGYEFLCEYDDGAQMRTIRPVTAYPGTPLFHEAVKQKLVKDVEDFYENKHKNSDLYCLNFMKLDMQTINQALYDTNTKLIKRYMDNRVQSFQSSAYDLYINQNTCFRGFR